MQGLGVGSIVHFSERDWLTSQAGALVCRAAIVTEIHDTGTGTVRLTVFGPHANICHTAVYSEAPADGTWHWPEKVAG